MRFPLFALIIAVVLVAIASRDGAPARAITGPMGVIETFAGSGVSGNTGDGGAATLAEISEPGGLAVAPNGDVFIASGCVVRKVSGGTISTVASVCAMITPPLNVVRGVAVAPNGDVVFSVDCYVMNVTAGTPVVIAGTNAPCPGFADNVPATSTPLFDAMGLAFDKAGNLYIADWGHCRVRKVDTAGMISTVAGNGAGSPFSCSDSGDGGPATSASLSYPLGVTVADNGDLYVAVADGRIRKVSRGIISTVAGGGTCCALGDGGPATGASLVLALPAHIAGLTVDPTGDIYIADQGHCHVRRVSHGIITTIAGNDACATAGDGGPAIAASLHPIDVALDSDGTLYVADYNNFRVRAVFGVSLDSDQDGYTDLQEGAISKDPQSYCATMRADVDGDGSVSILDFSKVAGFYLKYVPPAPVRYQQGPPPFAGGISILDLAKMAQQYGRSVATCP